MSCFYFLFKQLGKTVNQVLLCFVFSTTIGVGIKSTEEEIE